MSVILFFFLIFGHYIGDYALQSEYMALSKNQNHELGKNGVWFHSLTGHAVIHGGIVGIILSSFPYPIYHGHCIPLGVAIFLGFLEFGLHWFTDYMKCENEINHHADQIIHLSCKFIWVSFAMYYLFMRYG